MTDPADDTSTAANPLVGGPRGRVTVRLKDGKVLSGVYPALLALAGVAAIILRFLTDKPITRG